MAELPFEVSIDDSELRALVAAGVAAITTATGLLAEQLRGTHIPAEAPLGATGALGSDWHVREEDPLTFVVHPGPDAFYAGMVAGGTQGHGPRHARAMTVDGAFAAWVSGVPANPFDTRAVVAAERDVDEVIARALAEHGAA